MLEVSEKLHRLKQRFRIIIGFRDGQRTTLKRVVCEVLYLWCFQLNMDSQSDAPRSR